MSYREEVFDEIVSQHSKIFGRGPTVVERYLLKWQVRSWTYDRLLGGLVLMNVQASTRLPSLKTRNIDVIRY